MEGRAWAAVLGQDPANRANPLNPANPVSVPECVVRSNTLAFFADFVKSDTPVHCFFNFFLDLPANTHLLLRAFLEDCLPEMLSKVSVLVGRSMNMPKNHRAIAQAVLGDCGDPAPGSWIQHPGSWIQDPGSRIEDPGSWIRDHGSRIIYPGSWIRDPGSWILDPGSSYVAT